MKISLYRILISSHIFIDYSNIHWKWVITALVAQAAHHLNLTKWSIYSGIANQKWRNTLPYMRWVITWKACAKSNWTTSVQIFFMILLELLTLARYFRIPSNVSSLTGTFDDLLVWTDDCNKSYKEVCS